MVGQAGLGARSSAERLFAHVLAEGHVFVQYQPIVNIDSGEVVGFEALARGPSGSALESPAALLEQAARFGRLADLDWLCRATAIRDVTDASLARSIVLFLNVEPSTIGTPRPVELAPVLARAADVPMVLELTERCVTKDPSGLRRAVRTARRAGFRIALDDVGANVDSLP